MALLAGGWQAGLATQTRRTVTVLASTRPARRRTCRRHFRRSFARSWKQVGLVTLISVRRSPMTSMPASIPRGASLAQRDGDLAVAVAQGLGHALAAGGQVAADLAALRNARQRIGHRLAVDDQMRLSPLTIRPGSAAPSASARRAGLQRLGDAAQVQPVRADAKMPMPPMPSSGLRMSRRARHGGRAGRRRCASPAAGR